MELERDRGDKMKKSMTYLFTNIIVIYLLPLLLNSRFGQPRSLLWLILPALIALISFYFSKYHQLSYGYSFLIAVITLPMLMILFPRTNYLIVHLPLCFIYMASALAGYILSLAYPKLLKDE